MLFIARASLLEQLPQILLIELYKHYAVLFSIANIMLYSEKFDILRIYLYEITNHLNEQRPDVGRYSAFIVIDLPQCGQVIIPSFGAANNSAGAILSASANLSSVSNDGFCLPVTIPESDTRDTPTRSAKSFRVIPLDLQISLIRNCIIIVKQ